MFAYIGNDLQNKVCVFEIAEKCNIKNKSKSKKQSFDREAVRTGYPFADIKICNSGNNQN